MIFYFYDRCTLYRLAETEKNIRRRVALDEKAFRIVEHLLDDTVDEDYLLDVVSTTVVVGHLYGVVGA